MPNNFRIAYLSRSRLRLNRANLVQTLHTVNAFEGIGLDVSLFMPPWTGKGDIEQRFSELGIARPGTLRFTRLLHPKWKKSRIGYRPFITLYRRALASMDALFTRWPELSLALAKANLPHGLEIHDVEAMRRQGLLDTILSNHQRGVITWMFPISHAAKEKLLAEGADPSRISVSPSGVDLARFSAIKPFDSRRLGKPRILYAGRISYSRGLEIFEAVAKSGAAEVTLIGECEANPPRIANLHILPPVPHGEIARHYEDCDIALLPYQSSLGHVESISPIKLFEAMAAGRPIIASNLPSIREIISHGSNGLLVEPDNPTAWIQAVQELINAPSMATELATNARRDAQRYSWRNRALGLAKAMNWPCVESFS